LIITRKYLILYPLKESKQEKIEVDLAERCRISGDKEDAQ